jgi:hypothetical protein
MSMPIMRGDLGENSDDWAIVGSGRKVEKMKRWIKDDMLPRNWKELLGNQFVQFVELSTFSIYICPTCQRLI